ncbi:MAG: hypothetical protein V7638_2557 [Acidobacteriota bacterium]|jgi:hypothetical protein
MSFQAASPIDTAPTIWRSKSLLVMAKKAPLPLFANGRVSSERTTLTCSHNLISRSLV